MKGLANVIFTIGHSTHPIDELMRILQTHVIRQVVDVRTISRSRHNPQFNRENLPVSLMALDIAYRLAQSRVSRICRLHADH